MLIKKIRFILVFSIIGCQSIPEAAKKTGLEYPVELENVKELITERKTDDARMKVDDYLNRSENIHWFGHAYFLKAYLYEIDENFPEAIRHYKTAIEHTNRYDSQVEARALYNLSFVYERAGNLSEMLVSMIDLIKRKQFFDPLTSQVEIPARLAAAYASQGQLKLAERFHKEAANNYATLIRRNNFNLDREQLSKSLHYLGFATFDQTSEPFADLIKKLSLGQKYFLASAEASKSQWSQKSVDTLAHQYDRAWGMVQEYKPKGFDKDPQAFRKRQQMGQLERASKLYDLMHRLRAEEFPLANVNPRSKVIMDKSRDWLERIEEFSLKLHLGPEMTRSKAVKNTALSKFIEEKKSATPVNKERLTGSKKETQPSQESLSDGKNIESIGEDPNL